MDKRTAALTLTEKLRTYSHPQIIVNQLYQKKLIKESLACYQVGNPVKIDPNYFGNEDIYEKQCIRTAESQANYLFIDNIEWRQYVSAVSCFAIIGKEEVNSLRNIFYKNVPYNVMIAMKALNIKNYAPLYKSYLDGGLDNVLEKYYPLYSKFQDVVSDLFHNNRCSKSMFKDYFGIEIKDLNKKLKDLEINAPSIYDDESYVCKQWIEDIAPRIEQYTLIGQFKDLLSGFFNLAFTIPYEDQNIKTNTLILSLAYKNMDYIKILAKEYSNGKFFQEYFSCLDAERQKRVVDSLRSVSERNPVCDSFLWSNGFKDVGLDYLRLYREDADGFIGYFSSRSLVEKKVMLKDVMGCDFVNEKVVNWLNEKEHDLVREVGFDG